MNLIDDFIHNTTGGYNDAYRSTQKKITQFDDISFKDELFQRIEVEKNENIREILINIISNLGINSQDVDIGHFLIERIEKEKTKSDKSEILDSIENFNGLVNSKIPRKYINDKNDNLRHSAISALRAFEDKESKEALIEIIQKSTKGWDLEYALESLFEFSSTVEIQPLHQLLERLESIKQQRTMVLAGIINCLSKFSDRSDLELFIKFSTHRDQLVRLNSIKGLAAYATNDNRLHIEKLLIKIIPKRPDDYEGESMDSFIKPSRQSLKLSTEKVSEVSLLICAMKRIGALKDASELLSKYANKLSAHEKACLKLV